MRRMQLDLNIRAIRRGWRLAIIFRSGNRFTEGNEGNEEPKQASSSWFYTSSSTFLFGSFASVILALFFPFHLFVNFVCFCGY